MLTKDKVEKMIERIIKGAIKEIEEIIEEIEKKMVTKAEIEETKNKINTINEHTKINSQSIDRLSQQVSWFIQSRILNEPNYIIVCNSLDILDTDDELNDLL